MFWECAHYATIITTVFVVGERVGGWMERGVEHVRNYVNADGIATHIKV